MAAASSPPDRAALASALGAYVTWGFLPLYLLLVRAVPPFEFVGWRIIFTLPVCLLIVAVRRQLPDIVAALRNLRVLAWLFLSATLIAVNWLVYVWAIQANQVYAASLGYYINPLFNVLLGTLLLGERLSRRQWIAVALAGAGVALLVGGALTTLWISLTLAVSFGTYGMVRKQVAVGALPGLTIESVLLMLPATGVVWWYGESPAGSSFNIDPMLSASIVLGGVLTAVPLLLFAIAARRMPYSTLGFIQFLAPSIVFILGLTVFKQPLATVQAICFLFIWTAAAIFIWDLASQNTAGARSIDKAPR